jgi:hypothetical protein
MESENRLERERRQIVEAMDWIDAERKRLSRLCFSETRKKWHGERERGRQITLMKKKGEWLYRRRCRLRERIGQANAALKEMRRARSGRAGEGFGSAFVEAARERLPEDVFASLMDDATARIGKCGDAPEQDAPSTTVLDDLRRDMEAFMASNDRQADRHSRRRPETQGDFGVAERGGGRICAGARA